MKRPEYSVGAALMALLALGILFFAYQETWFEYDFSSGRKTAPGGAYEMEGNGVVRHELDVYATGWEGDIEPSDPARAQDAVDIMTYGLYVAAGALCLIAIAEIPGVALVLRRRVSLAFAAIALIAVVAAAYVGWFWLPESMAGHGVDSQFTAHLTEPDGYTHSAMGWGWYAMAASTFAVLAAAFFKFQAGHVDPEDVKMHLKDLEAAA